MLSIWKYLLYKVFKNTIYKNAIIIPLFRFTVFTVLEHNLTFTLKINYYTAIITELYVLRENGLF